MNRIGRWLTSWFSRESPTFDEAWRRVGDRDSSTGACSPRSNWPAWSPGRDVPRPHGELLQRLRVDRRHQGDDLRAGLDAAARARTRRLPAAHVDHRVSVDGALSGEHGVTGGVPLVGNPDPRRPGPLPRVRWCCHGAPRGAAPASRPAARTSSISRFAHQLDMLDGVTDADAAARRRGGPAAMRRRSARRRTTPSAPRDRPCCGLRRVSGTTPRSSSRLPPRCYFDRPCRLAGTRTRPVRRTPGVLPTGSRGPDAGRRPDVTSTPGAYPSSDVRRPTHSVTESGCGRGVSMPTLQHPLYVMMKS